MFKALLRAHFNPRLTTRAKMSLSRAQNIFMPANINYCFIALFYCAIFRFFSIANNKPIATFQSDECIYSRGGSAAHTSNSQSFVARKPLEF